MQKEKAWIHGILSGDGSLIKVRSRSVPRPSHRELSADKVGWNYKVILWNKNQKLLDIFDKRIKRIYGKVPHKCKDGHIINSKLIYENLKIIGDVGTYKWSMPRLYSLARRYWIRGFFDAEGTVDTLQKRIRAKSVNMHGLIKISNSLKRLGIKSNVTGQNCDGTWYITISRKKNVSLFYKLISFEHPNKKELLRNIVNAY